MRIIEIWKGLCRNCEDMTRAYFHPYGYPFCSKCGTGYADDIELVEKHLR